MGRAWISIGSNIDAEANVRSALDALHARYAPLALSPIYRSSAVGFEGEDFLNLVVAFDTAEQPLLLHDRLHAIESAHGRQRGGAKFAPRPLDLDLLLYDDRVLSAEGLELPRAEILHYAFVLRPLAELDPDLRHPLTGETMAALWSAFDSGEQRLWPSGMEWRPPVRR